MPEIRVHAVDMAASGKWQMRGDQFGWQPPNPDPGGYAGRWSAFDPFPAYPHDIGEARRAAEAAQALAPPLWDVDVWVCDREELARSNGHSDTHEGQHKDDTGKWVKKAPTGVIVLSGKRIPPHPAMTRYLVAHEYGHNVEWMIEWARGAQNIHDGAVVKEYAALRGLPESSLHHGDGGTWHDSAAEVLACDFRILRLGAEAEFWPHPGVPRPDSGDLGPALEEWWEAALADVASCAAKADAKAVLPAATGRIGVRFSPRLPLPQTAS